MCLGRVTATSTCWRTTSGKNMARDSMSGDQGPHLFPIIITLGETKQILGKWMCHIQ
jgi:hypothetical protein